MPVAPPATFSDEIRFSEVEVSLYSEFSDDEDEVTNNTKSKDDEIIEKEMFSKSAFWANFYRSTNRRQVGKVL